MILDIILLNKNNEEISRETIVEDFKTKLEFKNSQLLCDELIFKYTFQESKNNSVRLKISTLKEKAPSTKAKELDYLKHIIRNGEHRKNYRIIIVYDESSAYFCSILSNFISKFERRLRKIIYDVTLAAYGNKWIEETFTNDIKKDVNEKESDKKRHVEMALECFTFQNYIDYLFKKRYDIELEVIIGRAIETASNPKSQKEDIIKILNRAKKISLWDKLFSGYKLGFSEADIEEIRKIRNDVMHNREISASDFNAYRDLLMFTNKKIKKASLNVEHDKYGDDVNVADILYPLNETMFSMVKINKAIEKALSPLLNDNKSISDTIGEMIGSKKLSELHKLSLNNKITEISKDTNQIYMNSIDSLRRSIAPLNSIEKLNYNTNPAIRSMADLESKWKEINRLINGPAWEMNEIEK